MKTKTFFLGVTVCFGLSWLMAVVIPAGIMQRLKPVEFDEDADGMTGVYKPDRAGRLDGARIYAGEGCYVCHTQLIRPTTAGHDMYRDDWAGLKASPDQPEDTRRETNVYDYDGEQVALVGTTRIGPDLSNLAVRLDQRTEDPTAWLYRHLYRPAEKPETTWSVCPPNPHLFTKGGGEVDPPVPNARGKALVSYLLSLRKDNPIPAELDPRKNR